MTTHEEEKLLPMAELKSCPFCGGAAVLTDTMPMGQFWCYCGERTTEGSGADTEAEAVALWNRRALPAPTQIKAGETQAEVELNKLVEFFRGEGYGRFGYNGDVMGWSPAETAIAAMRAALSPKPGETIGEAHWLRKNAVLVRELGSFMSPGALAAAIERRADALDAEAQIPSENCTNR